MSEETVKQNVQLTIRCAMQSFEDRDVECPLEWTVLELKQHLFNTFPSKPEVVCQRLIYAGHCLDNAKSLRSILQARGDAGISLEEAQVQVIHLVCASKDSIMSSSSSDGLRLRQNAACNYNNPTANVPYVQVNSGLSNQPTNTNTFTTNMSQPQFNQAQPQNIYEAYAASYQNYLNQMSAIMQQQQLYFQQNAVGANPIMMFGPNFGMPQMGQVYLAGQPNNFANAFGAAALGAMNPAQQFVVGGPMVGGIDVMQQQHNVVNAAAHPPAAGEIQGDGENRQPDLLDLVYKLIRFLLLTMVLYLYSSVERFFFVLFMVCGIWLVQMRRERRNRNEVNQQRLINPLLNDNNNNNELTPDRAQGEANTVVEENQMNSWTVFWSTVSSFFTSLIPENPVPINVN